QLDLYGVSARLAGCARETTLPGAALDPERPDEAHERSGLRRGLRVRARLRRRDRDAALPTGRAGGGALLEGRSARGREGAARAVGANPGGEGAARPGEAGAQGQREGEEVAATALPPPRRPDRLPPRDASSRSPLETRLLAPRRRGFLRRRPVAHLDGGGPPRFPEPARRDQYCHRRASRDLASRHELPWRLRGPLYRRPRASQAGGHHPPPARWDPVAVPRRVVRHPRTPLRSGG